MKTISIQSGLSLIATILALLLFSLFIAVAVSLVTTGANIGVQETQGQQAFYIAEGGVQYAIKSKAFPNYSLTTATNLGAGSFTVATPAYLTADPGVAGTTISVNSTTNFPNAGRIVIDSELITYTGTNPTQFNAGVTRGVGGTTASAHPVGNAVYPVTTVTPNPIAIGDLTINVASTTGFIIPGIIKIDNEYIYCTSTNAPSTTQFTNCTRGYKVTPPAVHPVNSNVFQYIVRSTGTITSNPLANPTQRVVRNLVDSTSATILSEPFPSGSVPPDIILGNSCTSNPALSWCYTYTSTQGISQYHTDNAPVSTGGSLEAESNAIAAAVFTGYRQRTLSANLTAGTQIQLSLWYKKTRGHAQARRMDMSVELIATDNTVYQIWLDNQISNISWTQTPALSFTVPAGKTINRIRLLFDIQNKLSGGGSTNPSYVWFDEINLTTATGVFVLSWQERF